MDAALAGQLKLVTSILGPTAAIMGGLAAAMGLAFLLNGDNGSLNASFLESGSLGSSEA